MLGTGLFAGETAPDMWAMVSIEGATASSNDIAAIGRSLMISALGMRAFVSSHPKRRT